MNVLRPLIIALTSLALTVGLSQADLVWTGAVDDDVFNEANWDQDGAGPPPAGTVDPSVPIQENASITGASVTQGTSRFGMGDAFTATLDNVIWGVPGAQGWIGDDNGSDIFAEFDLINGSDVTIQFITEGGRINVDATSIVRFKGAGDPINSQSKQVQVNLAPGAQMSLPTVAEFTEQGDDIVVNGVSFNEDNRILVFNGTIATAFQPSPEPPTIETQPISPVEVVLGGDVLMAVTVSGDAPFFYQWQLGGVDLADATNASLVVTNAGETAAGPYICTVSNALGSATTSDLFLSYIGSALDPAQQVVFELNPIEIAPVLPDDDGRTYQWRKDGLDLAGQTDMSLTTPPVTAADSGNYDLVYSLGGNTVTSQTATVIVPPAPTEAYADLVIGDMPRAYWRLGEAAGAIVATEEIGEVADGGLVGDYGTNTLTGEAGALLGDTDSALRCLGDTNSVVEVDGTSDTTSTLGVSPFSAEIWALAEGGQGTFRAPFAYVDHFQSLDISGWSLFANDQNRWEFRTGEGPVNSPDTTAWNIIEGPPVEIGQWAHLVGVYDGTNMLFYVNGVLVGTISDAAFKANTTLGVPCTIGGGSAQDGEFDTTGDYWIGKLDEAAVYGAALTASQVLEHYTAAFPLDTPPSIDTQPQDTTVLEGVPTRFFVAANSVTPPTYQWLKNGAPIPGETGDTLLLAESTTTDVGSYSAIISNYGGSVTSDAAMLTVIGDVADTSVSVSFIGFTNPNELIESNGGSAGLLASAGWAEIGANVGTSDEPYEGFTDDRSVETGISVSWSAKTNRRGNWSPLVNGDHAMMTGFIESRDSAGDTNGVPVMLVISNIPSLYTTGGYDVIVYMGAPAGAQHARYDNSPANFMASISDGSQTYYYHGMDGRIWDGTNYVAATTTDAGAIPLDANYAEFTGLTASTLVLTADAHPVLLSGPGTISGFQILPGRSPVASIPMTIGNVDGTINVDWTGDGVLQSTTDLPADDWTDVEGGTVTSGPYPVPAPQAVESFRLRAP